MYEPTYLRDVARAMEELRGIVAGIACDYEINVAELEGLGAWLVVHRNLIDKSPFNELAQLVQRILEDGTVDEEEHEVILDWCQLLSDPCSHAVQTATAAIQRLHGFLNGIAIDGVVTEGEVKDLRDWLLEYEDYRDKWPFNEVWVLVDRVLADGKIDRDEQREVLNYCQRFAEREQSPDQLPGQPDFAQEAWMITDAPVLSTLADVCEKMPRIAFEGKTFCFTGQAVTGKRKDLEKLVQERNGIPKPKVVLDLDYLVVGSLSQPCWIYSAYGRKIEAVLENRKKGSKTLIVLEDDFVSAVQGLEA